MSDALYDVAVVGGGPAGLATALHLADLRRKVLLIEASHYEQMRVGEHLGPNGLPLLQQLDVRHLVESSDHLASNMVRVRWGSQVETVNDYMLHPYGHGYNLTRPLFDTMLVEEAKSRGVSVRLGCLVGDFKRDAGRWHITINTSTRETDSAYARFLIDATGRTAAVGTKLGAERVIVDRLIGVVGTAATIKSAPRHHAVNVESMPDGWWYAAHVFGDRLVASYMTDADILSQNVLTTAEFWRQRLARSEIRNLGIHSPDDALVIRSACTQRLIPVAGDSWAAVGDAAIAFDPLSSQGISKGLSWGIQAAKAVDQDLSGQSIAMRGYVIEIEQAFHEYLQQRSSYYAREQRWPDSPFWRRRHNVHESALLNQT